MGCIHIPECRQRRQAKSWHRKFPDPAANEQGERGHLRRGRCGRKEAIRRVACGSHWRVRWTGRTPATLAPDSLHHSTSGVGAVKANSSRALPCQGALPALKSRGKSGRRSRAFSVEMRKWGVAGRTDCVVPWRTSVAGLATGVVCETTGAAGRLPRSFAKRPESRGLRPWSRVGRPWSFGKLPWSPVRREGSPMHSGRSVREPGAPGGWWWRARGIDARPQAPSAGSRAGLCWQWQIDGAAAAEYGLA